MQGAGLSYSGLSAPTGSPSPLTAAKHQLARRESLQGLYSFPQLTLSWPSGFVFPLIAPSPATFFFPSLFPIHSLFNPDFPFNTKLKCHLLLEVFPDHSHSSPPLLSMNNNTQSVLHILILRFLELLCMKLLSDARNVNLPST